MRARGRLLLFLGLGEQAIVDAPPKGERQNVLAELFESERRWLVDFADKAGLTRNPSPARSIRVLIRAAIANRDLLPVRVELEEDPPWLESVPPLADRLAGWLDQLPDEVLEQLAVAVKSAIARRRK